MRNKKAVRTAATVPDGTMETRSTETVASGFYHILAVRTGNIKVV